MQKDTFEQEQVRYGSLIPVEGQKDFWWEFFDVADLLHNVLVIIAQKLFIGMFVYVFACVNVFIINWTINRLSAYNENSDSLFKLIKLYTSQLQNQQKKIELTKNTW